MQNQAFASQATPHLLNLGSGSWHRYVYDDRPYFVYTPVHYHVGTAVPLVVMLHGCLQIPDGFAYDSRMNEDTEEEGGAANAAAAERHRRGDRSFGKLSEAAAPIANQIAELQLKLKPLADAKKALEAAIESWDVGDDVEGHVERGAYFEAQIGKRGKSRSIKDMERCQEGARGQLADALRDGQARRPRQVPDAAPAGGGLGDEAHGAFGQGHQAGLMPGEDSDLSEWDLFDLVDAALSPGGAGRRLGGVDRASRAGHSVSRLLPAQGQADHRRDAAGQLRRRAGHHPPHRRRLSGEP